MAKSLCSAVRVKLDGNEYDLTPNLRAAKEVSRRFEGFGGAFDALAAARLDAFAQICRAGIDRDLMSDKDLEEAVFRTGLAALTQPLITFLVRCQNGGRDPDETDADASGEDGEGNGRN